MLGVLVCVFLGDGWFLCLFVFGRVGFVRIFGCLLVVVLRLFLDFMVCLLSYDSCGYGLCRSVGSVMFRVWFMIVGVVVVFLECLGRGFDCCVF